jgi:hypothetical protein
MIKAREEKLLEQNMKGNGEFDRTEIYFLRVSIGQCNTASIIEAQITKATNRTEFPHRKKNIGVMSNVDAQCHLGSVSWTTGQ